MKDILLATFLLYGQMFQPSSEELHDTLSCTTLAEGSVVCTVEGEDEVSPGEIQEKPLCEESFGIKMCAV